MSDRPVPDDFATIERIIRTRRATRHLLPDPVPDPLLHRLIELARWAPSGYNLQPTNFVLVTDQALKNSLHAAFLNQRQVLEAPALLIFTGDLNASRRHFEPMLKLDLEAGASTDAYATMLRRIVPLAFSRGPAGLGWLWKATLLPLVRCFRPIPVMPAVDRRYWTGKQVMLVAMTFMLAAEAAGLATSPMEGFDEGRVRRALNIPRSHIIPIAIAVGYAAPGSRLKTRLPLESVLHHQRW